MANKYNIGDTVTVTATVADDRQWVDGVECRFNSSSLATGVVITVPYSDIATHTPKPRPIQVGDIVGYGHAEFTVIAIHNDSAWLKRVRDNNMIIDQEFYTLKLNVLERV